MERKVRERKRKEFIVKSKVEVKSPFVVFHTFPGV
jgi:hypothetical protein